MIFRIILFLLPIIMYVIWLLYRKQRVRQGKKIREIPTLWLRVMAVLALVITALLLYFGISFEYSDDGDYKPFRPETFIQQRTTR